MRLAAAAYLVCQCAHAEGGWIDRIDQVLDAGTPDLYLSGYIHHGRGTYTRERIAQFNEAHAWGVGYGKSLHMPDGPDESLYAMGISDSHYQPQLMAGYAWQWTRPLGRKFEGSVGWTAQLVSRQDYFGGFPFPLALPLAAIGTRGSKLMVTYVPRLSKNKGSGDVLFFFVHLRLD
ncbi:MAG: hypothetical protein V4463_09875 [Pseudomonadota bacterium]